MSNIVLNKIVSVARQDFGTWRARLAKTGGVAVSSAILLVAAGGCRTSETGQMSSAQTAEILAANNPQSSMGRGAPSGGRSTATTESATNSLVLQPGDTLHIGFPGAPTLDTSQVIRRDGKITLPSVGEFQAGGLTPGEVERQLHKLYEPLLQTPEVNVTVQSSAFIIYVTGAVGKPGQLNSDRRISPIEAVIEAGVDMTKGNLRAVSVIRVHPDGRVERHKLNLKRILVGRSTQPFDLQPLDIIYVPEKFTWF